MFSIYTKMLRFYAHANAFMLFLQCCWHLFTYFFSYFHLECHSLPLFVFEPHFFDCRATLKMILILKIIEWFFELFGIIKSEQFELKPLSCFGSSKIQQEQSSTVYDFWFSKPFQLWLNNKSKSNEHTHAHKIATEGVWVDECVSVRVYFKRV